MRASSSVVERVTDNDEVGGPIPPSRTRFLSESLIQQQKSVPAVDGYGGGQLHYVCGLCIAKSEGQETIYRRDARLGKKIAGARNWKGCVDKNEKTAYGTLYGTIRFERESRKKGEIFKIRSWERVVGSKEYQIARLHCHYGEQTPALRLAFGPLA
ncbi:MAG: hypothetical protein UY25_C0003G0068 [Candidatus Yanofskybacteria bacterium GW2011_GWC1_48_11]|uniref:Uncharacterized protein n=1 Tax=Candidatus Yanofskybacteria bacterium GW2011_GWC1_48_11 TaxID=1619027 RepID=A0A837ILC8_9BACT|nr:MAG: hypothetical protein UY25_C0003G0068 [Candidatus Yanofskybacteria bacterium GW2011_GWC1_48_11]